MTEERVKAKQLKQQADADPLLATKCDDNTPHWTGASPADYPLGSTQSRAIARAWVEAKSPRNHEKLQRDEDALLLYQMKYELHGPVYPDYSVVEKLPIFVHANELRLQKYGPILPAHEWPTAWNESTQASREFRRCFGRDPKAGDLLRWEHVRVMRGAELYEQEVLPQIAAWERQIQNLSCPLKFENGRLFKRNRRGEWFEEISVKWQYHWIQIQSNAGVAVERTSELLMHPYGDVDDIMTVAIKGVVFLGVINGKHACRPATREELRRPETDHLFRDLFCKEPKVAPTDGTVVIRDEGSGYYAAVPVATAMLLTEGPSPEYTRYDFK